MRTEQQKKARHRIRSMRSKTIHLSDMRNERSFDRTPPNPERPTTRGECSGGERPCPFVTCRHHLYLDIKEFSGSLQLNFPDREVEDMQNSCSLDIADGQEKSLEEIAVLMNITRERVRQIEAFALVQLRKRLKKGEF